MSGGAHAPDRRRAARLLTAALLALASLLGLWTLRGITHVEYRVGFLLLNPDGSKIESTEGLRPYLERGLADDVVQSVIDADPRLRHWTPAQARDSIDVAWFGSPWNHHFATCQTPDTSCRHLVDGLVNRWLAMFPPSSQRYGLESPDTATATPSGLHATVLLASALGLALAALLASGLLRRSWTGLWRVACAWLLVAASMRMGAFNDLLTNGTWQKLVVAAWALLGATALGSRLTRGVAPVAAGSALRRRRLVTGGLVLLCAAAALSSLGSPARGTSLVQTVLMTGSLAVVLASAWWRWTRDEVREGDVDAAVLVLAALLGAGLVARAAGADWPGNPTYGRFQSFLFNPNIAGLLAAVGACLALARVLQGRRRVSMAVASLVFLASLALTGSRGALVGLLAGLVVLGWVWGRWRAAAGMAVLALAGAGALVALTRGVEGGLSRLGNPFDDAGRLALWHEALQRWRAHPLLGAGYRTGTDDPNGAQTVHNVYLSVLGELGLVGAVALLLVAAAVVWGLTRGSTRWLAAGVAALAAAEVFDSSMLGFLGIVGPPAWLLVVAAAWGGAERGAVRMPRGLVKNRRTEP